MAKKEVKAQLKFLIMGGNATPGQKIGPALGQHGVNIGDFVSQFNERTQDRRGELVPTILTIYADRSFIMEFTEPPVSFLVKEAAGIKKGSGTPNTETVGSITDAQVEEIAKRKMSDFNTRKLESVKNTVAGTAKSLGVEVKG